MSKLWALDLVRSDKRELTDSFSVAVDGSVGVLQLHELVAHQGPRGQVVGVQLQSPLKILDCLFVLRPERDGKCGPFYKESLAPNHS